MARLLLEAMLGVYYNTAFLKGGRYQTDLSSNKAIIDPILLSIFIYLIMLFIMNR